MKKVLVLIMAIAPIYCFGQKADSLSICQKIEKTVDKFRKDTSYRYGVGNITLRKNCPSKGESYYYVLLFGKSDIPISSQGATLLLSNGELVADSKADIKFGLIEDGKYLYTAYIELSSMDIPSMLKYPITDFRMGTHDESVKNGYDILSALKCMINQK